MKYEVYCVFLQLINSLEGLGMFFSSAVLTRRLRKHTATIENLSLCEYVLGKMNELAAFSEKAIMKQNGNLMDHVQAELWIHSVPATNGLART